MSFAKVAARIAKKQGVSKKRASAMLAAGTRKTMAKHGMKPTGRIPKNVFSKMKG